MAKRLLKPALIARLGKDYSWTAGHTGHCSMGLVEIARSEITELNAQPKFLDATPYGYGGASKAGSAEIGEISGTPTKP